MLARRFLYAIAILVMLLLAAAVAWNLFQDRILRQAFVPSAPFAVPPGEIDYSDPANWLAHPGLPKDPSHWNPAGFGRAQAPDVAVFYLTPTTYFDRDRWNAPLDDATANARLRLFGASQASAFNGTGEVWAPRYRQATLGAFLTDEAAARKALDFAYHDVSRAFDDFLREIGPERPIILAGHSQGSAHLFRLLHERIAGTPLARRVVAAYVVGWPISVAHDLPALGLPACTRADQPNCILGWQSYAEPAEPRQLKDIYDRSTGLDGTARRGSPMLCVDPLTGSANGAAEARANLGALVPRAGLAGADIVPAKVGARCDAAGLLLIGPDPGGYAPYVLPGNNFHVFDYALFWANIRADAARRTAAFLRR